MQSTSHTFDLGNSIYYCAKRYRSPSQDMRTDGYSLVFAHSTCAHKEQWEPVIERIFSYPNHRCYEAWSLDCPSHGDSAIVNEKALTQGRTVITIHDYANMLHHFLVSGLVTPERCICIGHSSSTSAWTLASQMYKGSEIKAIVFVEPVLITVSDLSPMLEREKIGISSAMSRKNTWDSAQELATWMRKRHPWRKWDPRIFELYMKYGFRSITTSDGIQVTPKCAAVQEVELYKYEPHVDAGRVLHQMCKQIPVHCVFAALSEMVSREARESMCDESMGRVMASVSLIPNVGHLAPQENPNMVADEILQILLQINSLQARL